MTARKRVPPEIAERLGNYYGNACVVTGDGDFQWHHLDDDDHNSIFENLVPLRPALNLALRDASGAARDQRCIVLRHELTLESLDLASKIKASAWDLGGAYGTARLGCFVARNYFPEQRKAAIAFACQAIYFARHRLEYSLIEDTFRRSLIPALRSLPRLPSDIRFRIIRELAGIFAEHGEVRDALELYSLLGSITELSDAEHAARLRRQATSEAALNGLNVSALDLFREASELSSGNLNHRISAANSLGWLFLAESRFREALDSLEPVIREVSPHLFKAGRPLIAVAATAWNAAELFHNYGLALVGAKPSRYKSRARLALERAAKLFQHSGSGFYDIRPGSSLSISQATGNHRLYGVHRRLPTHLTEQMREVFGLLSRTKD